jgi:hypothetical protein
MEEILFIERQRFRQLWIWALLLAVNGLFVFGIYHQIGQGKPFGNHPASDNKLIIGFVGILLVSILFLVCKLETIIKTDAVYVRFFPFHIAYRKYSWDKIDKAFVRTYKPIGEYGGWGLRKGFMGNALNVSGNKGLQLIFTSNNGLLIGTNKPAELENALREAGRIKV